jgi:hypothetical protein
MATATLRERFSKSDEELRRILSMDGELSVIPLEAALRILVDSLKESPQELEILVDGSVWISELQRRIDQPDSEQLRERFHHGIDLILASHTLAEIAVEELAAEYQAAHRPSEEDKQAHALRREALLTLIVDNAQEQVEAQRTL